MYSKKNIKYVFTNTRKSFDAEGSNKLEVSNAKSSCRIDVAGMEGGVRAEIVLYGLGYDLLAKLSADGVGVFFDTETVNVEVFADNNKVFAGNIYASFANLNDLPDSSLILSAASGGDLQDKPSAAFSRPGAVPVFDILESICRANGYGLIGRGIKGIIHNNPHFDGCALDQIRGICKAHELLFNIYDNTVFVWTEKGTIDDVVPLVSPEHGLIGYPVFSQYGITFQTQFSTLLVQGRAIELQTSLPHGSGRYKLANVQHFLSSWTEGGRWHSVCMAYRD
ncbi:hypothetical protein [Serratia sp. UGAL515B_01]|uniref:hypothetical protein n=1 Tax=Serratia sp. UGAL515B_01 TaxID=2986763 RepID=UPI002953CC1A|nr:hypothetical protein [Serratia sp. UGAL515B_01]WON77018.1 hypothetical protein OK023_17915 [Serratia sp. UGAL515B_01]